MEDGTMLSKINWAVRFKNRTFLLTFIPVVVGFIYTMLGMFEVVPAVSKSELINGLTMIVSFLATLGIVTDPTTAGMKDSSQALDYTKPKEDVAK